MISPRIAAELGSTVLEGNELVGVHDCQGTKFHSPQPMLVHEYRVSPEGLGEVGSLNISGVWLCGTCADKLRVLLALLSKSEGDVAWEVRREFGNPIREIASKVWPGGVNA